MTTYKINNEEHIVLEASDFYPPKDNRALKTGIQSASKDNTYRKHLENFFQYCEQNGVYD